jgi:acyl-CoA synthetase (AMP-forming)/AMP-acid ligase II
VTPADLLAAALRRDPSRPLVTWYDDASGERVELSVATAANWAAKTANLLAEDDIDAVRLDPAWHWLAVVVALGAWTAGVPVGDAGEPLPGEPKEFIGRVLPQPDALVVPPPLPDDLALSMEGRTWTLEALGLAAVQAAAHHRLEPGARAMSALPLDTLMGIDAGLLMPLAAGGSVVLVAHADESKLAKRAEDERVTNILPSR